MRIWRRKGLLLGGGCIVLALAVLLWGAPVVPEQPARQVIRFHEDQLFLPHALRRSESQLALFASPPIAAIGPHHLPFSGTMLTDLYAALARDRAETKRIILLSPDHRKSHLQTTTTACLTFETSLGKTECAEGLVEGLLAAGLSVVDDEAIALEHGLYSHLAYIQSYFPEATLAPVMFGEEVGRVQTRDFGAWLHGTLQEGDLLIVSTDLSHYQSVEKAAQEDHLTLPILLNVNLERLPEASLDTRPAMQTLFDYLRLRRVTQGTLIDRANSADFGADSISTTSYATVVY